MIQPKSKPIIMSADSVRAILAGAKNQTRRVIKPQPHQRESGYWWYGDKCFAGMPETLCMLMENYAPYQPGDLL